MYDRLIQALVRSKNDAADDVLLEGLRLGSDVEKPTLLAALMARQTTRGLSGVIERFDTLPEPAKLHVLSNIKPFYHALRECGRSDRTSLRASAMKIIALSRQGKLAYVLSENLHAEEPALSKAAVEALVALARWVATETKNLQKGLGLPGASPATPEAPDQAANLKTQAADATSAASARATYALLMEQRPEIETAVARAMDVHRGQHSGDLLRAALLLCDWPQSKTLAVLHTAKHGGQGTMVRRLQQAPASEHVDAFLLGATHGQLRTHFGTVFAQIHELPVLDAMLRKTHWLKDNHLQICMHQVTRGFWWTEGDLVRDVQRRPPADAARIAEWLAASGQPDVVQDERMAKIREHAEQDFPARLRLLRIAMSRKRAASCQLLRLFLTDPDERLVRMAARELVRRKPPDFENMLLQLMTGAPESVRRVIGRAIGQAGFDHYWQRFDRLDKPTRKQAGKAMLKLLPDALQRLMRRLGSGTVEHRLKAMQIAQELSVSEAVKDALIVLSNHPHPKVRSKAVSVLGEVPDAAPDALLERVLNDADPRVRANAIEVLGAGTKTQFLPLLAQRARAINSRERANAIRALQMMKVGAAASQLMSMLRDERAEHRISALWALRQIGWWKLLGEVGRLAKEDTNIKVRRYALGVLKGVASMAQETKGKTA